jgi:quercetin dioxygenase-like cupin family protein
MQAAMRLGKLAPEEEAMEREAFEAELRREGYVPGESELPAGKTTSAHSHDFDVRALVLAGEISLTCGGERRTYRRGDEFRMTAGAAHEEEVGPEGVRYLVGRRAKGN